MCILGPASSCLILSVEGVEQTEGVHPNVGKLVRCNFPLQYAAVSPRLFYIRGSRTTFYNPLSSAPIYISTSQTYSEI